MGIFRSFRNLFSSSPQESDEQLTAILEGFDIFCSELICETDASWDASTRMHSYEYCVFLYGAAIAIIRGYGREDEYAVAIFGPYLSRFMDWQISVAWLLECETQLAKSPRLQGVQAAGANTAQSVVLARSQGRSEDLSQPHNTQILFQVFSEMRKLMADKTASDEPLFSASGHLYESIVGK